MLQTLSLILDNKASKLVGFILLLLAYYRVGDGVTGLYDVFSRFIAGGGFEGGACLYFLCSLAVGAYLYYLRNGLIQRFKTPTMPDCVLIC